MQEKQILGEGPAGSLLVISDAPWKDDIIAQKPFFSPHGKHFRSFLSNHNLLDKTRFEYLIPRQMSPEEWKAMFADGHSIPTQDLLNWKNRLLAQINLIKPKVIIVLGDRAFNILFNNGLNFEKTQGYVLNRYDISKAPIIATYHPAHMYIANEHTLWLQFTLAKAQRILKGETEPKKILHYDNDFDQAITFLEKCKTSKEVCIDIETIMNKNVLTAIGFSYSPNEAMAVSPVNLRTSEERRRGLKADPIESRKRWNVVLKHLKEIHENPNITKIGQNYLSFDAMVLSRAHGFGFKGVLEDTMEMFKWAYPDLSASLADIKRLIGLNNPWKAGQWKKTGKDLLAYCAQDVAETHYAHACIKKDLISRNNWKPFQDYFLPLYEAAFNMYVKGTRINIEEKEKGLKYLKLAAEPITKELQELVGNKHGPGAKKTKPVDHSKSVEISLPGLSVPDGIDKLKAKEKEDLIKSTGLIPQKEIKKYYFPNKKQREAYGLKEKTLYKKGYGEKVTLFHRPFNPNSAVQKLKVAQEMGFKIKTGKKKDNKGNVSFGPKFDKKILEQYIIKDELKTHEQKKFVELLLKLSPINKLKTSYYGATLCPDGRWHSVGPLNGTETNRQRKSGFPGNTSGNDQQIPRDPVTYIDPVSGETKKLKFKSLFIPDPGKRMGQLDQDAAEAKVVAYLSGCKSMIDAIENDVDLHLLAVAQIYGENYDELLKAHKQKKDPRRQLMKPVRHGYNYRQGPNTVAESIMAGGTLFTAAQAEDLLKGFDTYYPEIDDWHEATRRILLDTKTLVNPFGRKRIFLGHLTDNPKDAISEATLRSAIAHIPQSTIPTISNIMWRKSVEFAKANPHMGIDILNQCHDSLLYQTHEEYFDEFNAWFFKESSQILFDIVELPTGKIHKNINISWSGETGPSWGELNQSIKVA